MKVLNLNNNFVQEMYNTIKNPKISTFSNETFESPPENALRLQTTRL